MLEHAGPGASALRARRAAREEAVSFARRLDWLLLSAVAGIVAYGLWVIAGITRFDVAGNETYFVVRQGVFAALGAAGLVAALLIDPDVYRRFKRALYVATTGLMVLVILVGSVTRGSKRWIDVGFFQFQPSEFGKVFLILFLAGFLADRGRRIGEWSTVLAAVGLAFGPIVLVFIQPDFGTALVYGAALAAVLFIAGTRWLHLAGLAAAAALGAVSLLWALPAVGVEVLKPYQSARLTAFADPDRDPSGSTYNVNQSIVSVGAGGVRGRGVQGATQTNLDYLPEHATDFVFASLAEQRGFVGASVLLCLYLLVLWRGIRIISIARDSFSAIVAGGIVFALLFQIFINVGMTMGIAPITGIPLPFVSVGGSSMIANLLAMGVLQAIHVRGRSDPRRA
ncbi:MAG: rod shape-determining protein RodA [Gaiellaceae bacterium]